MSGDKKRIYDIECHKWCFIRDISFWEDCTTFSGLSSFWRTSSWEGTLFFFFVGHLFVIFQESELNNSMNYYSCLDIDAYRNTNTCMHIYILLVIYLKKKTF